MAATAIFFTLTAILHPEGLEIGNAATNRYKSFRLKSSSGSVLQIRVGHSSPVQRSVSNTVALIIAEAGLAKISRRLRRRMRHVRSCQPPRIPYFQHGHSDWSRNRGIGRFWRYCVDHAGIALIGRGREPCIAMPACLPETSDERIPDWLTIGFFELPKAFTRPLVDWSHSLALVCRSVICRRRLAEYDLRSCTASGMSANPTLLLL